MKKVCAMLVCGLVAAAGYAATDADVTVNATVGAGVSEITATPASLTITDADGGAINVTKTAYRFWSDVVTMDYFFANAEAGWLIKCYTENADGATGMVDSEGNALPLRIWTPGFGPTGASIAAPPSMYGDQWRNPADENAISILPVPDVGAADPRKLVSDNVNPDKADATMGTVELMFATDASAKPQGSYSTVVTFEMIFE